MYKIEGNKILIYNCDDFNPKHILECGQVFRYEKQDDCYIVYSLNKKAIIHPLVNGYAIETNDTNYFCHYFDLQTDYAKIKNELHKFNNEFLNKAINFGYGIRILKQSPFEMIISFIISANNNIPRIKNSIKKICESYGENMGDYYAFPTCDKLCTASEEFFKSVGLGYRASYMVHTLQLLKNIDIDKLNQLDTSKLRLELESLKGVGRKVADCIMLFGFNKADVFPIDTWTNKVYLENFYNGEKSRNEIANFFVNYFGNLSGYAQQYFYYWKQKEKGDNKKWN